MSSDQPTSAGPGPRWTGDGSLTPRAAVPEDSPTSPAHRTLRDPAAQLRAARVRILEVGDVPRVLATPLRRFGAALIDFLIRYVLLLIVLGFAGTSPSTLSIEVLLPAQILARGWDVIFFTQGWTPGSRLLRMRIVRLDGTAPGPRWGIVRAAGAVLSETPLWLGHVWAFWDPKCQTWHDRIAGTVVVEVPREPRG